MPQNEHNNILEFIADRVFDTDNQAPEKPKKSLSEIVNSPPCGERMEQAISHYLAEQKEAGLLPGLSDKEIAERFTRLFNLGGFTLLLKTHRSSSNQLKPDMEIKLLVWDGEQYQNLQKTIVDYLDTSEAASGMFGGEGELRFDVQEEGDSNGGSDSY